MAYRPGKYFGINRRALARKCCIGEEMAGKPIKARVAIMLSSMVRGDIFVIMLGVHFVFAKPLPERLQKRIRNNAVIMYMYWLAISRMASASVLFKWWRRWRRSEMASIIINFYEVRRESLSLTNVTRENIVRKREAINK